VSIARNRWRLRPAESRSRGHACTSAPARCRAKSESPGPPATIGDRNFRVGVQTQRHTTPVHRVRNEILVASVMHRETRSPDVESTPDDPTPSTFPGSSLQMPWRPQCLPVGTMLLCGSDRLMRWGVPNGPAEGYNPRMPPTTPSVGHASRTTLDLFETGLGLMRQNLRRDHPDATDQEIERRLHQWLRDRPGAEFGDCPGRRVDVSGRLR
jgi:hypothetical protein